MNVGLKKPKKKLSVVLTTLGSATITALAFVFISTGLQNLEANNSLLSGKELVTPLNSTSSDASSEPDTSNTGEGSENDTTHGLPCFDPDCSIHNGHDDSTQPIDISMDEIMFKPDTAKYVNEVDAINVLTEYLNAFNEYFDKYPDGKIYLVGGVAKSINWVEDDIFDINLSQNRADTVKASLVALGLNEDKIITIGVGVNDPWRNDEWVTGQFDETIAKTNRRVLIIPDAYNGQLQLIFDMQESLE